MRNSILFIFRLMILFCSNIIVAEECTTRPISIYLSWQEDPTTTMTVRWISPLDESTTSLHYKPVNKDSFFIQEGICKPFPNNEPYALHTVCLKNLTPKTVYSFHIEGYTVHHLFETMPKDLTEPLSFIIGGDINFSNPLLFQETTHKAAELNPAFIIIGGDFACAFKKKQPTEDVQKWLTLMKLWYETAENNTRLIPLLSVIGNHDIQGSYGKTLEQAPFFSFLLLNGQKSFSVLRLGTYASLYLLDSGHAALPQGEQSEWLAKELERDAKALHRIAVYHVPAYPPVRSYRNAFISAVRRAWPPLFDTYRLHLAFENHDHAYKRTYPLKDSQYDPRGVVYIGDGSWGTKPSTPKSADKTTLFEKTCHTRGFCFITLKATSREVSAINFDGSVIDSFSQPIDSIAAQEAFEKDFMTWKNSKK